MESAMSKAVIYVGVDVGATELWISAVGFKSKKFSHDNTGIKSLYRWVIKHSGDDGIHLCMEATGVYSQHVAVRLIELPGIEVSIVNPACIKAFANVQLRRSKTDMIDAEVIRCYAESQKPSAWQPASKTKRQLYELVRQADSVQASLQQWRNRRYTQEYIDDFPKAAIKAQRAIVKTLEKQLDLLELAIDQLCAADADLAHKVMLLESIPGIARKSAVRVLAHGQDWLTDRSAKALTAHAGLAPHHHQSGTSIRGRSRIDKRGNRKLRKALYMPALVGIVHNPILEPFYKRLCDNGKQKKLALTACMRKLLLIIRSMLINKTTFNHEINNLT
jgi:transposase